MKQMEYGMWHRDIVLDVLFVMVNIIKVGVD